jgi:hypothetical protein
MLRHRDLLSAANFSIRNQNQFAATGSTRGKKAPAEWSSAINERV